MIYSERRKPISVLRRNGYIFGYSVLDTVKMEVNQQVVPML